ncbi:hypothetical protein BURC_04721 [Burkholderiaceae bacterium]|nr:hypothetical protein BURC_04721 [Burkholderiaceae bacterium]
MRASPAFQVTLRRFGIWRTLVAALLLSASAGLAAWALTGGAEDGDTWLPPALAAGGLLMIVLATQTLRCPPLSLRWDAQAWHLGPASAAGEEPWPGRVAVAMDFGAWMLLRFEHNLTAARRRVIWLPVQRRGIEPQWHALRCAVYSSRPAEGRDDARAASRPESEE